MATTFLTKTLSGSPTDNNKWTFSCWFKISKLANTNTLIYSNDGGTTWVTEVAISDAGKMVFQNKGSGGTTMNLTTNRLFRDVSAWYHVVAVFDSSNSTEADRQIIYINGVRETSFATNNPASLNEASTINDGYVLKIGKGNTSEYHDGSMSHINFIDGQALAPTVFGETDSTTGEWKIKTSPSVTYGTNGFFILKDGNSVTDQSGNSNNFTVAAGTLTNNKDNPSNNFATVNASAPATGNLTSLKYGNLELKQQNNPYAWPVTLCGHTGKWYWEQKVSALGTTAVGILKQDKFPQKDSVWYPFVQPTGYAYKNTGNKGNNNNDSSYGNSYTSGDILSVAFDQTNGTIWFGKNGTWQNNATDTQIAAGTTTYAAFSSMSTNGEFYGPFIYADGSTEVASNFGNGYFGITAVASAGTNASGNGVFEYDVPAGYTALSTKGLNL